MPEQQDPSGEKPKKFILRLREPVEASTTQGQLRARHIGIGDLKTFSKYITGGDATASTDYEELGKLALLTLVNLADGDGVSGSLTEEIFARLSPEDTVTLVHAVAKACELEGSSTIDSVSALGAAVAKSLSVTAKRIAENAAAIRKNIDSSFSTLSQTLKSSLGDQVSELSAVRSALGASSAVGAAQRALQAQNATASSAASAGFHIPLPSSPSAALAPNFDAIHFPKFEETAPGRTAARAAAASEESARQLSEVTGLIGTMAEQMADLQTVFLTRVLPEWFNNLESSAETTNTTLRQAESSLFWAKWALVASVAVTIGMTAWQVGQTAKYEAENDKQQAKSELLLTQQLQALQELNKQLTKQAQQDLVSRPAATGKTVKSRETAPTPNEKLSKASNQKHE